MFRAVGTSRANWAASWCCSQMDYDITIARQREDSCKKVGYTTCVLVFGSFVECVTCAKTVCNVTVLYDHRKHIRFPKNFSIIIRYYTLNATSRMLHIPDISRKS
jgi:hypothetical protein